MTELLKDIDQEGLIGLLLALAIGVLMGSEREHSKKDRDSDREIFAGIRTFPLLSLLGYLLMFLGRELNIWIFILGMAGMVIFSIVSFVTAYQEDRTGGTTQVATIIAFLLGGMVQAGFMGMAVLIGILVTGLLAMKIQLHTAIGKVEQQDIFALLQFIVLAVLVFPLLPEGSYGPYEVLEPRSIWRIVIIILGIDFLGYLLSKFIGKRRGAVVTGVLGGFASSTAVAWTFSRKSKREGGPVGGYAGGVVLASSIMFGRILIWLYIWNKALFWELLLPVFLLGVLGVALGIWIVRSEKRVEEETEHEPRNPLNLTSAVTFGLLYAGILLLVAFAEENFGDKGVYLASGISGLTDVDAITISMSKLEGERFALFVSHVAIVIGAISNSLLKYGICLFFGSPSMRKQVSFGFLPLIFGGLLYLLIKGTFLV